MGNCCQSRMLLEKKGEQPRTKSYDNCNVRFSFHKICQLILNRVFSSHYYILCCISSLITQHLALSTDCLFLKAYTSSLTLLKQQYFLVHLLLPFQSKQCKKNIFFVLCNIFLYVCSFISIKIMLNKNVFLCCVIFSCTFAVAISIKIMLKTNFLCCVIFLCLFAVAISIKIMLKNIFLCCVIFSCTFAVAISIKIMLKERFIVLCNIFFRWQQQIYKKI